LQGNEDVGIIYQIFNYQTSFTLHPSGESFMVDGNDIKAIPG